MDMVKKRRYITEPEVRFYTVQIAGAIKYMHSKGIIHRDLKMGNIFLDENMNVKVGDFGLAALLMSGKDMSNCRRTTLCGTPNYIAPEILERGKKGHDHAVDIWSLGIIIFALLTGKPPFQANSQEEIYRKAREREYDWPTLDTSENQICEEAKDLVSKLLVSPEERPDSDTIVQHPFFSCGWVPQPEEMTPKLRDSPPSPNQFPTTGRRQGSTALYARNLKKLCVQSDVGPYSKTQRSHTSTYREVAAEEKAGLTPFIPLAEGVVYMRFDVWLSEQHERRQMEAERASSNDSQSSIESSSHSQSTIRPSIQVQRSIQPSFAAQQRAQNQPVAATIAARLPRERVERTVERSGSTRVRSAADRINKEAEPAVQPAKTLRPQDLRVARLRVDAAEKAVARIGSEMVEQLKPAPAECKRTASPPVSVAQTSPSLFNSREILETLPSSKPEQVLQDLKNFHAELERALKSRSLSQTEANARPTPPIVIKWVDYTNKFGLGYILSNGSVGCIFRSSTVSTAAGSGRIPPTCVLVRDAERHLRLKSNEDYEERDQLVPQSGSRIDFYENRKDEGICRARVHPRRFAVVGGKMAKGADEYQDRKSEKIVLWNKFAKYMTQFGRDPDEDVLQKTSEDGSDAVVTFYQRFGDVGCWRFGDGSFQFNFPDHTKIILSSDGTWCDFYHLPLEAARDFAHTGALQSAALDDRQKLSYPLQTLLNFMAKPSSRTRVSPINPMLQGIPQANDFKRKIEFIRNVTAEWIRNGGLGNSDMRPEGRIRWLGYRELVNVKMPQKHVWVTVGARGGDDRRVAWFDPRKPDEIVPDIEAA